jgi:hypothetical protein
VWERKTMEPGGRGLSRYRHGVYGMILAHELGRYK